MSTECFQFFDSLQVPKISSLQVTFSADSNGSFARQFPLLFLGHLHHIVALLHVAGLDFEPCSGSIYQISVWRVEMYKGSRGGV